MYMTLRLIAQIHPMGEVVQSLTGIKRLERSCRRWQL